MTGPDAGKSFLAVNPQGNVPALVLDGGLVLAEQTPIQLWIADNAPESKLAPAAGTPARYEMLAALSFVGTDLHAGTYAPMFNPAMVRFNRARARARATSTARCPLPARPQRGAALPPSRSQAPVKEILLAKLQTKLSLLESKLKGKKYFLGDEISGADLYAYICTSWGAYLGAPDLKTSHPEIAAYRERIGALDFVQAAHAAMAKASPPAQH